MDNADISLQEQLARLEHGTPLKQVLAELPVESKELASLIVLASASSQVTHPKLSNQAAQAQKARIMAAASQRQSRWRLPFWQENQNMSFALAGMFALIVLIVFASLMPAGSAYAQASLVELNGLVEVAPSAESTDWHFVASGEKIHQGQRVRTYADSSVTLTYQDGSRTFVSPDADLVLTQLTAQNSSLQVQITQFAGLTTHAVIPLRTSSSFFQVDTPTGSATVRGTNFNVDVKADGEALFAVTHGKVAVSRDGTNVLLTAGQTAATHAGQTDVETGYQFSIDGPINSMNGTHWVVNGAAFDTDATTVIVGTFNVGDPVLVRGRILSGTSWIADRIEPSRKNRQKFSFTGLMDVMGAIPGNWTIGGQVVSVTQETDLDGGLKVGNAVEVSVVVLEDGSWAAQDIKNLDIEEEKPTKTPRTPTPTATPTATSLAAPSATHTPTPTFTLTPTSTYTPTPTGTLTATVAPKNDTSRCEALDQQQPEALRLADRYIVGYDEIMTWFCKGFGFGEIDLAYSLSRGSGKQVNDIFSMRGSGVSWGQIKKDLSPQYTPTTPSKGNNEGKKPEKTPEPPPVKTTGPKK